MLSSVEHEKSFITLGQGLEGYKSFFLLSSTEHEIYANVNKC